MTYRKGRPLSIRWLLEPLLGRARIEGGIGHTIDAIAIIGTLFGVATSLGFGVQQISAGLDYLGWVETGNVLTVVLITCVTGLATFSVVSGVSKGLKCSRTSTWFSPRVSRSSSSYSARPCF